MSNDQMHKCLVCDKTISLDDEVLWLNPVEMKLAVHTSCEGVFNRVFDYADRRLSFKVSDGVAGPEGDHAMVRSLVSTIAQYYDEALRSYPKTAEDIDKLVQDDRPGPSELILAALRKIRREAIAQEEQQWIPRVDALNETLKIRNDELETLKVASRGKRCVHRKLHPLVELGCPDVGTPREAWCAPCIVADMERS